MRFLLIAAIVLMVGGGGSLFALSKDREGWALMFMPFIAIVLGTALFALICIDVAVRAAFGIS